MTDLSIRCPGCGHQECANKRLECEAPVPTWKPRRPTDSAGHNVPVAMPSWPLPARHVPPVAMPAAWKPSVSPVPMPDSAGSRPDPVPTCSHCGGVGHTIAAHF